MAKTSTLVILKYVQQILFRNDPNDLDNSIILQIMIKFDKTSKKNNYYVNNEELLNINSYNYFVIQLKFIDNFPLG